MNGPTLLTIILNYKTSDMTLQSAAAALREMDGIAGALTIVDNDSQDRSFEVISKAVQDNGWDKGDRVQVIQSGHNGGFGAGNNVGIRAGLPGGEKPDFVYILNSDAFPDKGAIRNLLDYLTDNPSIGFAGSYIHGPDGDPHPTAFRYPSPLGELEGAARFGPISRLLADHIVPLPVPGETCMVDWLAGASLMMRRSVLDEIGLFDERFFLYFEETDLCLRARRADWPTVYVRTSEVTHIGSVSTGMKTWRRMPKYWFDSRLYYFMKNHGVLSTIGATIAHLTGGALWQIRRLVQRKQTADPKLFLWDMATHGVRAAMGSVFGGRKILRPSAETRPQDSM